MTSEVEAAREAFMAELAAQAEEYSGVFRTTGGSSLIDGHFDLGKALDAFLAALSSTHVIVARKPPEAMVEAASRELEEQIKLTSAEMQIDLEEKPDDPLSGIFPQQREDYRRWMRAVLPVALSASEAKPNA